MNENTAGHFEGQSDFFPVIHQHGFLAGTSFDGQGRLVPGQSGDHLNIFAQLPFAPFPFLGLRPSAHGQSGENDGVEGTAVLPEFPTVRHPVEGVVKIRGSRQSGPHLFWRNGANGFAEQGLNALFKVHQHAIQIEKQGVLIFFQVFA